MKVSDLCVSGLTHAEVVKIVNSIFPDTATKRAVSKARNGSHEARIKIGWNEPIKLTGDQEKLFLAADANHQAKMKREEDGRELETHYVEYRTQLRIEMSYAKDFMEDKVRSEEYARQYDTVKQKRGEVMVAQTALQKQLPQELVLLERELKGIRKVINRKRSEDVQASNSKAECVQV